MVASINLHRDSCPHWEFYSRWIVDKLLAVWKPGNKWNPTARNRLNYAIKQGYVCRSNWMDWNENRDNIHKINTSAEVRQGNPMNPAYFVYPEEKNITNTCEHHRYDLFMVFRDGVAYAYAITHLCGNYMNISTILGHHDYLKDGIMLPLMKQIQDFAESRGVVDMTYGEWTSGHNENGKNGLQYWKHSVGFEPTHLNELT